MQSRKKTAWKKNRKFGDIHGGRVRLKFKDGIVKRLHNLLPPNENEQTPIFIVENTSRDFYFPVTIDEIKETLNLLPKNHTKYLTHIWLAKVKKSEFLKGETVQGSFICGSKVYLIKLFAIPTDNKMIFGQTKPTSKLLNFYRPYCTDLQHDKNGWFLQWTEEKFKKYFLEKLLLHEIGHSVDYFYKRIWSKANLKQVEDFADDYAVFWSNNFKEVVDEKE